MARELVLLVKSKKSVWTVPVSADCKRIYFTQIVYFTKCGHRLKEEDSEFEDRRRLFFHIYVRI